jgi:YD repeat-containing protein
MYPSPLPDLPPGPETVVRGPDGQMLATCRTLYTPFGSALVVVFDPEGRLISETLAHADGDYETATFSYESARVRSVTSTDKDGETYRTDYDYDSDGRVVRSTTPPADGTPWFSTFTYHGNQVIEIETYPSGKTETTVHTLDDAGRVINAEKAPPDT